MSFFFTRKLEKDQLIGTGLLASKACCFSSSKADCGVCRGHHMRVSVFLNITFLTLDFTIEGTSGEKAFPCQCRSKHMSMRWLDCCWTTWTIHTRGKPKFAERFRDVDGLWWVNGDIICNMFQLLVLRLLSYAPVAACLSKSRWNVQGALYSLTRSWRLTQCCLLKKLWKLSCHSVSLFFHQVNWPMISRLIFRPDDSKDLTGPSTLNDLTGAEETSHQQVMPVLTRKMDDQALNSERLSCRRFWRNFQVVYTHENKHGTWK